MALFELACDLMMEKWEDVGEVSVAEYFKKEWLGRLRKWCRAFMPPGLPSTNNALERYNGILKILQRWMRLPLDKFFDHVKKQMTIRSEAYGLNRFGKVEVGPGR